MIAFKVCHILQFIRTVENKIKKQNEFVLNYSILLHNNTGISHINIFVIFIIIVFFSGQFQTVVCVSYLYPTNLFFSNFIVFGF